MFSIRSCVSVRLHLGWQPDFLGNGRCREGFHFFSRNRFETIADIEKGEMKCVSAEDKNGGCDVGHWTMRKPIDPL
jgi:hypothetical protein